MKHNVLNTAKYRLSAGNNAYYWSRLVKIRLRTCTQNGRNRGRAIPNSTDIF